MNNKRLNYIDNIKGVLILLVILTHCIQDNNPEFDDNLLVRCVYSFHMPLFIYLSGYLCYKPTYKWESLKRRFMQCIVPFFAWSILGAYIGSTYSQGWLEDPGLSLWFLWAIFWLCAVNIFLTRLANFFKINELILVGAAALIFDGMLLFAPPIKYGFYYLALYLPYYCLGAANRKYSVRFSNLLAKWKFPLLMAFALTAPFYMRSHCPTFLDIHSNTLSMCYKYLTGTLGCLTFMAWSPLFLNKRIPLLSDIGGMTLGLYAIHVSVLHLMTQHNFMFIYNIENLWLRWSWMFILATGLSLVTYYAFNLLKWSSFLFLGNKVPARIQIRPKLSQQ